MARIPTALLLGYDGARFRGWQRQPGMATVQAAVEEALGAVLDRRVQIFGAARTDADVHAEGQVCHFVKESVATPLALAQLAAALRERLPADVELKRAALAHPSFHARSSSIGKRYCYRFAWGAPALGEAPDKVATSAHAARDAFHLGSAPPDWERARSALAGLAPLPALPGLASPSTDRRPAPPLSRWRLDEESCAAQLTLEASAFRKHQVRNIAGHLAAIALGLAAPESLAVLARRARPWMGACAPAAGLTLLSVLYPPDLDPFAGARG